MTDTIGRARDLVIVRAGPASLHPAWLAGPTEARAFDCVVSYFDLAAHAAHRDMPGVAAFLRPGGKWDGLAATLDWLGPALDRYDYIWLPDDDIATDAATINALFAAMRRYDLAVAQPSLTPDSHFTHFLFVQCPDTALRRTNAVEIMVPCLSRRLLQAVRPLFADSLSGFGLDYIWCRLPEAGPAHGAIIDALQVRHTRPVGKVLAATLARHGVSPKAEQARLDALYGVTRRITPLAFALETTAGKRIDGAAACGVAMAARHLRRLLTRPRAERRYGVGKILQLLRRQFTRTLDLSPLIARAPSAGGGLSDPPA